MLKALYITDIVVINLASALHVGFLWEPYIMAAVDTLPFAHLKKVSLIEIVAYFP